MRTLLLSIVFIFFTAFIHAQEKAHFYLQGEIGPAINTFTYIYYGRESLASYHASFFYGIACDIETGIKNNSLIIGLGSQLFYPEGTGDGPFSPYIFAPYIKFGCNYFKNKTFFLGNYIAAGFFYQKYQVEHPFIYYPHVKTGLYFSRKSLAISLNINEYLKYDTKKALYNVFSINLEIGYCFNFGKHKEAIQ